MCNDEKNNFKDFQDFAEREILAFAKEHKDEDTARLLLGASRYPGIDMQAAVQQIEGLRTAREKWPSLLECGDFLYPPRLNREQSSSEATAHYKAQLLTSATNVVDLTGGMGVDTLAFAKVAGRVDYVERDPALCALMERNLRALGVGNVAVHCADSIEWLSNNSELITPNSALYIDPARRSATGRKVAAFEDCTPNILEHLPLLCTCGRLLVKASPMADIDLACRQLGCVDEVHVVAVKGECKELLFLCCGEAAEPRIVCAGLNGIKALKALKALSALSFTRSEKAAAEPCYCAAVGRYLYEPDAAVMKTGPFALVGQRYGLAMLARNSHLYTSDTPVEGFPGRRFEVLAELKLSRKAVLAAIPGGTAHVVVRNYPVDAAALQRQLGLREGGDLFVVATTVGTRKAGFLCKI